MTRIQGLGSTFPLLACVALAAAPAEGQVRTIVVPESIAASPAAALTPEERFARLEVLAGEAPDRYDLQWQAAREGALLAAGQADEDRWHDYALRAHGYATAAKALEPSGVEGRYWLAVASGLLTEVEGGRTKIRYAQAAWDESSWVLEADSLHAGAHHLQGRLHAAVMRLGWVTRLLARTLLGADLMGQASWEDAEYHLRRAAELAPGDAVHHLELAMTYKDTDRPELAREALRRALETQPRRAVDTVHLRRAREELAALDEG